MDVRQLDIASPKTGMLHDLDLGGSAWALADDAFATLMSAGEKIYERFARGEFRDPEALEAYKATYLTGERRIGVRGKDTAILYIEGTIVKRESWLSQMLGLPTYETLNRDLHFLAYDDRIKSIILYVDSPGGEVSGCGALAHSVYSLRGRKPVTAFVSGNACSAAYWIASAASRVVVNEAAVLGSIGVAMTTTDHSRKDTERGITRYEFVSSNAPKKRPNLETDAGKSVVQKIVDDLAEVFIKDVAKHRGVSVDTVLKKFGAGGVEIGANAVKAGMADEIGQFENVLAGMQRRTSVAPKAASSPTSTAIAASPRPIWSAEDMARQRAEQQAAEAARAAEAEAEAKRKADIDALWKAAADRTNASLGPYAVKSDDGNHTSIGRKM